MTADGAADLAGRLDRVQRWRTEHLRLVPTSRPEFTAAATRLFPDNPDQIKGALAYRQQWQAEAWDNYDDIAEIGRSADFMSDAMSRIRWFPGVRLEPDGDVLPLDATDENDEPIVSPQDAAEVTDAFRRLGGGSMQSIAGLFAAASLQIFVPGEGYLLGYTADDDPDDPGAVLTQEGEVWRVVASERLSTDDRGNLKLNPWKPRQSGTTTYSPQTGGTPVTLPPDTFVIRFWQPHPRDSDLARSAVYRVRLECEELRIKLFAIRAQELQRMNAGILVVPARASLPAVHESKGGPPVSPLTRQIIEHMVTPTRDPGSAASVAPFVLEIDTHGPQVAKPEWLMPPQVNRKDEEERDELSRRIVMALPVPAENILGLGEEANFANARIVTEQTYTMHVAPHADVLGESFTIGYLRREIVERGVQNPQRFAIGADPTDLIGKPGQEESVSEAHERITVSDQYYRASRGIPEDAAPDDEEIARRLSIAQGLQPTPGAEFEPDPDSTDPNAEEPQPMAAAAVVSLRAAKTSKRLARIEADLRAKVHAYLASLIERAVEKAGAKARTNARRSDEMTAAIGQVANRRVCAQLGPAMVAALDLDDEELLTSVLAAGKEQVITWTRQAQDEALRMAQRLGDLDDQALTSVRSRQDDDREAGWLLILAALTTVARVRLFDPDPVAPEVGEFDGSPLPMAPIAAGLARAGGASGNVLTVPFSGARLPAAIEGPDGEPEPGGATAGPTGREALSSAGFALVSWTWETGTPERPFEPHQDLDGLEFRSFFDDALTNSADWPPHPFFYAGDHAGCLCQQVPSFEEAT